MGRSYLLARSEMLYRTRAVSHTTSHPHLLAGRLGNHVRKNRAVQAWSTRIYRSCKDRKRQEYAPKYLDPKDLHPKDLLLIDPKYLEEDLGPKDRGSDDLGVRQIQVRNIHQINIGPKDLGPKDLSPKDLLL